MEVRIGIGLPAAVPGTDMSTLGQWAADAESAGFVALGVIDRLVYDNLEPLTALAAAARTERVELLTTVLNVGYRNNPVLLAKQMASVERLSGGRLTAGLGLGGWPEDYAASRAPQTREAPVGTKASSGVLESLPPYLTFGGCLSTWSNGRFLAGS